MVNYTFVLLHRYTHVAKIQILPKHTAIEQILIKHTHNRTNINKYT